MREYRGRSRARTCGQTSRRSRRLTCADGKSPLMDGARFARNLEAAYREMWEAWCDAAAYLLPQGAAPPAPSESTSHAPALGQHHAGHFTPRTSCRTPIGVGGAGETRACAHSGSAPLVDPPAQQCIMPLKVQSSTWPPSDSRRRSRHCLAAAGSTIDGRRLARPFFCAQASNRKRSPPAHIGGRHRRRRFRPMCREDDQTWPVVHAEKLAIVPPECGHDGAPCLCACNRCSG